MKKQFTVFSILFVIALSFVVSSCGSKTDEALLADFNAKKADAQKMLAAIGDNSKMMMTDHAAWKAKLDSVKAADPDDAAKIDGFEAEMTKHEDMGKTNGKALTDSLNAYIAMNPTTNDALKAASAGIAAQLATGTSNTNTMMDAHKKLGADIMAFLGGESKEEAAAGEHHESHGKAAPAASTKAPTSAAPTANENPNAPKVTKKSGGGGVIKQ